MSDDSVRATITRLLGEIAPEADFVTLDPARPIRDQLDIDSMDFLNFVVAIHDELGVDIPEADYGQVATLDACTAYVSQRLPAAH